MPQQQPRITRRNAHKQVKDGTRGVADLGEGERGVEGAEDVGGDEVEDGGPGGDAEGAAGVEEFGFVGCEDRRSVFFLTEAVSDGCDDELRDRMKMKEERGRTRSPRRDHLSLVHELS